MPDHSELADRPADVALSAPEPLAKGFFDYKRYRLTLHGAAQTRDVVLAGKVVAVLPIDPSRASNRPRRRAANAPKRSALSRTG
jgi:hypothetical protein